MSKGNGDWIVRFEKRLYSSESKDDVITLTFPPDQRSAGGHSGLGRIALPRSVGYRLMDEDKAREAAEAAAALEQEREAPRPTLGELAKGGSGKSDDYDLNDDDKDRGQPEMTLPLPPASLAERGLAVVFSQGERDRLPATLKGFENDKRDRLKRFADAVQRDNGVRDLRFDQSAVMEGLDCLAYDYPNLASVVDFLRCEFAIALAGDLADFRVSPVLLVGEPGIGKTAFCRALAGVLDVGFDDFSAGGAQGGFDLCGTSAHYGTCTPGRVFRLLADGKSAAPVLLIDEVDKISGDDRFPVMPTLLNLAERDSAAQFRDECLDIRFDASRMLIVMTANDLSAVPAPLLSRVQVIEVPSPTAEQRRAIATRMLAALPSVAVPDAALDRLAESDVDLREVQRRLRRAVGEALARGAREIEVDAILDGQWKRRPVGFV